MIQIDEEIVYATKQMIPQLKELWMEAFGDDMEYIDFYFDHRFTEDNMLVYLHQGRPICMTSLLKAFLWREKNRQEVRYVYAVATKKEYRSRGYAKALLQKGYQMLKVPFILQPAEKGLETYYQSLGFRKGFNIHEYEFQLTAAKKEGLDDCIVQPEKKKQPQEEKQEEPVMTISAASNPQQYWILTITPHEYKMIRDREFKKQGYVEWDEDAISYALLENDFCDGYSYKVFHNGREDLLMYRIMNDQIHIIETTLTDEALNGVFQKLRMEPKQVFLRRPQEAGADYQSFGMIYGENELSCGYLNLTLE